MVLYLYNDNIIVMNLNFLSTSMLFCLLVLVSHSALDDSDERIEDALDFSDIQI